MHAANKQKGDLPKVEWGSKDHAPALDKLDLTPEQGGLPDQGSYEPQAVALFVVRCSEGA